MALIDALMAGQQFVAGMQQQQQAAREYRDRMAMLAREEGRAMRQEGREIAGDIRSAQFQDFQRRLMESGEERAIAADTRAQELQNLEMELARAADTRAEEQLKREGITANLTQQQLRQAIDLGKLEIEQLKRDAENAPNKEKRERLEAEARQKLLDLQVLEAKAVFDERQAQSKTLDELSNVQTALTRVARQVQVDPASLTAQQALAAEKTMYDFIDRNPEQVQALSPYYNTFFNALEMAEGAKGSLLTKRGVRSKYKEQYAMEGNPWTEYGRTTLPRIEYRTGLEEALAPVEEYMNLRDSRESFLSLIGQPIAYSMTSGFPQED
jgi:hypothetical protein